MRRRLFLLASIIAIISSCTANKYLPEGKLYYDGATINWEAKEPVPGKDRRKTIDDMTPVLRPDPNVKILGMRPKVWFYHIAGDVDKEKGFKYWLKYKVGGEPVYLEDVNIAQVDRLLENRLMLNGFFNGRIEPEVLEKEHSASVRYKAVVYKPYRYDTIAPISGKGVLVDSIRELQASKDSLLFTGARYDFDRLEQERGRIENGLKNEGFYYFDGRFILFRADSTVVPGKKRVALFPTLKDNITDKARTPYTINKVTIHSDYLIDMTDTTQRLDADTVQVQNMTYITRRHFFRPEIIANQVQIRPGERYDRSKELRTINRLIQLDVFRIVNVEFSEAGEDQLNTDIYLSPYKKKSIRFELSAVTTSQSFAGPHIQATFRNRNFLGGAERYELSLTGSYEWQIGGKQSTGENRTTDQNINLLNSFEIGLVQSLLVPRLITPFNIDFSSARYIPQTRFGLSFKWLQRVGYYQFNSAEATYGFEWRETMTKRHSLTPVSVTYIRLGNTTEEFDNILKTNEILRRSLEDQFIVGTNYSFFYSTQEDPELSQKRNNFYFNGNLGVAGNLLYGIHEAFGLDKTEIPEVIYENGEASDTIYNESYTVLGLPFAQYIRTELDFRHYYDFNERNRLASRFIIGVGYPFGNSETMPYSKQFAVGGASSLRGFRARSLGPGTYEGDPNVSFIDQTGEIRLEFNTEWRFRILAQIKGAIFFDIGNVWTVEEDNRTGGKFEFSNFLQELAMNTGVGVRYDAEIFVLRLDLGIPLRVPYSGSVDRSPVLNIAIGYPF